MAYDPHASPDGDYAVSPNRYSDMGGKYYASFVTASPAMKAEIMAHEGFHYGFGAKDLRFEAVPGPYGSANAQTIARWGPAQSMRNADNLAFAFGFVRDD